MLTQEHLHELLSYDPETGKFVSLVRRGKMLAGSHAGTRRHDGYFTIFIEGKRYLMHRLAWLHVTGEWPANDIDHIDGNPSNNKFSNLRDVRTTVNLQNLKCAKSNNIIGLLGVSRFRGGYMARIVVNGNTQRLGVFPSTEEAHAAYLKAKRELHEGCTI